MRKRSYLVPVSFAAHVAAGVALWAAGVWTIERLPTAHAAGTVGVLTAVGSPGDDAPLAARPQTIVKKHVADHITQPERAAHVEAPVTPSTETGTGSGDGTGSGTGSGGPSSEGPPCAAPPCEAPPPVALPPEPPPVPKPVGPRMVPQAVLARQFLSGERDLHPPDTVVTQMTRDDHRKSVGVLKVCVATTGEVSSASMLRSTGYDGYDARLVAGVRQWRYRPVMVDGVAVAACGTVTFLYEIH
jgi:TonB family protein